MAILSHLLVAVLAASAALGAPSHAAPAEIQRRAPSAADQKTYLDLHNTLRAKHHASALTWNQTLSNAAASWAGKCVFQHSGGKLGPYGENLSAGFPLDVKGAVQMWINEESQYNPKSPQYSHYTQMVWKGTKQLGCAEADCKAGTIFPKNDGKFYVCEYYPQGNVIGQFPQNVQ